MHNPIARKYGLYQSLFSLLIKKNPNATAPLRTQYRMNSSILSLSNHLIYDNQLLCGNDDVANAKLTLPIPSLIYDYFFIKNQNSDLLNNLEKNLETLKNSSKEFIDNYRINQAISVLSEGWIREFANPNNSVIFANIDTATNPFEHKVQKVVTNQTESNFIIHVSFILFFFFAKTKFNRIFTVNEEFNRVGSGSKYYWNYINLQRSIEINQRRLNCIR